MSTNDMVPLTTQTEAEKTIGKLLEQREKLLNALYTALPFVEDAAHDPCFKPGHVKKVERDIRGVLESIEHAMKVPATTTQG